MTYIDDADLDADLDIARLVKLLNLTRSTNDGEALNAIQAANRSVKHAGTNWEAVIGGGSFTEFQQLRRSYRYLLAEFDELKRSNRRRRAEKYAPKPKTISEADIPKVINLLWHHADRLTEAEREFIQAIASQPTSLTAEERDRLHAIARRVIN